MELECTQVINESFNDSNVPERGRLKVGLLEIDGTTYEIFTGENVIGRDMLSDIVIDKGSISSKHAVVEVESCDSHLLYDCGSTNKTRLGKVVLKPNVMYNLQGGEEILFADVKAKYTKVEQPGGDERHDDSGSETGSESMLDCGATCFEDDVLGKERPVATALQGEGLEGPADGSLNNSNPCSDLNESSVLEKKEIPASQNQVIDASFDESTDDEEDFFVQPSQTVKEFTSRRINKEKDTKEQFTQDIFNPDFMAKQVSAKNASRLDHSKDIFDMETQDTSLLDTVQDENKCSAHLDSQDIFNTEMVAASFQRKILETCDPVFESETETTNLESECQENVKSEKSTRNNDKHLFDAETEMVGYQNYDTCSQKTTPSKEKIPTNEVSNLKEEQTINSTDTKSTNQSKNGKRSFDTEVTDEKNEHGLLCKENVDNSTESLKISSGSKLEDVEMSELAISSAFTENSAGSQQLDHSRTNIYSNVTSKPSNLGSTSVCVQAENAIPNNEILGPNCYNNTEPVKNQTIDLANTKSDCTVEESIFDAPTQVNTNNLSQNKHIDESQEIADQLTERIQISNLDANINKSNESDGKSTIKEELEGTTDEDELFDALTQVNHNLNKSCPITKSTTFNSSKAVEIATVCLSESLTQLNPRISNQQVSKLPVQVSVKTGIMNVKKENDDDKETLEEDDLDLANQETQLYPNVQENPNEKGGTKLTSVMNNIEDLETFAPEETQVNMNVDSRLMSLDGITRGEVDEFCGAATEPYIPFKEAEVLDDSDNTDIEDNVKLNDTSNISKNQTTASLDIKGNCDRQQHSFASDENSTESDSVLASMPLDLDEIDVLESKECFKEGFPVNPDDKVKTNQESQQTDSTFEHVQKGSQGETIAVSTLTIADMDVCSTVGGMHFSTLSTCEKSTKKIPETLEKNKKPSLHTEAIDVKATSVSSSKELEQTNTSHNIKPSYSLSTRGNKLFGSSVKPPKNVLNDSLVLSDPCSSSTPFKSAENNKFVDNVLDSKKDCLSINVEACSGSPSEPKLIIADSSSHKLDPKNEDMLPLALKRTPRLKKVSRKLAESKIFEGANKVKSAINKTNKMTNNKATLNKKDLLIVEENDVKFFNQNIELENETSSIKCDASKEIKTITNLKTELKSTDVSQKLEVNIELDTYGKEISDKAIKSSTRTSKRAVKQVKEIKQTFHKNVKSEKETKELCTEKNESNSKTNNSGKGLSKQKSTIELIKQLSVSVDSTETDNILKEQSKRETEKLLNSTLHNKEGSESNRKQSIKSKVLSEIGGVDGPVQTTPQISPLFVNEGNDEVSFNKRRQAKEKTIFESFNKEEGQSPVKRTRINQNNDETQLDNKPKVKTKQKSTRTNKDTLRTTKESDIVKDKISPGKKEPTETQSTPCKRTSSRTIISVEIMSTSKLQDIASLNENSNEPPKKSRKVSKAFLEISESNTGPLIKEANILEDTKLKNHVTKNSKKFIECVDKLPSNESKGKLIIERSGNVEVNKSNQIKKDVEQKNDNSPRKSCRITKGNPIKVKEETSGLLSKNTREQTRMKGKCDNDTEDSSCVETAAGKIEKHSTILKDEKMCVETSVRGSKRTRSKPNRFCDSEESGLSDSSSRSSTSRKQRKSVESLNIESLESKRSLSSRRHKNSSTSNSVESIESISISNDKNKCDKVFVKPVKSSRNSKKKSKLSESNDKTEDKAEDLDKSVLGRRSRSRDSLSSLTSEDSRISIVSASPRRSVKRVEQVLFTVLSNPKFESYITKLGGSVVDSVNTCSVLVTDKVRRTVKFLCAVGQGKPIVSPNWIAQSWKCCRFEDPLDHLLLDTESEERFSFKLSLTLKQAKEQPLLTGYTVHATPNVKPPPQDITSIVECCGGTYLEKLPSKWPIQSFVISHPDDRQLWKKLRIKGCIPPIVETETLLAGVLQHRIDLESHRLT